MAGRQLAGGEAVAGAGEGGVQRGPAGTEHVERVVRAAATQNVRSKMDLDVKPVQVREKIIEFT